MNFKLALLGLLCASPAWAARPDALEVLRASLDPTAPDYVGKVAVETFTGGAPAAKEMAVHVEAPGRYRREILDAAGETVQLVVSDGKTEWIYDKGRKKVWEGEPADPYFKRLGPDEELELLTANYDALVSTGGKVANRPAWLLELRSRADGKIQRRLWIDQKYGLILRSEILQPDGAVASAMRFTAVSFPKTQDAAAFRFSAPKGSVLVKRLEPDYMALDEAKAASGMEPKVPSWLPSGYVFESLDVMPRGSKKIIHYRFSDGINVLSLFQCPPRSRLDFGQRDGHKKRLKSGSGTLAWTREGHVLGWSSGGVKFVLVGALEPEALQRVAESIR